MNITTPKELMISRYEAFKNEDWHYIANTSIDQTFDELSTSPKIEWLKLDVLDAYENIVEFKAYYRYDEKIEVLHEISTFVQLDGIWKYKDGKLLSSSVERNESCPCGSGKKYKKCCMK
jgi:SEC-C motif-containing protein